MSQELFALWAQLEPEECNISGDRFSIHITAPAEEVLIRWMTINPSYLCHWQENYILDAVIQHCKKRDFSINFYPNSCSVSILTTEIANSNHPSKAIAALGAYVGALKAME